MLRDVLEMMGCCYERELGVELGVVENDWSNSQVEFSSSTIKYLLRFFSPTKLARVRTDKFEKPELVIVSFNVISKLG
jgi:hypothetical protein